MINFFKTISIFVIIVNVVTAYELALQKFPSISKLDANQKTAHISPEIINELKDFETLIPKATIDEIAAEHLLLDGNFRKVVKYLNSDEFTQLQKQLLDTPEIVDVLEFLHLTAENATTMHMGATEMPTAGIRVAASLEEYNSAAATESYERNDKMTTDGGSIQKKSQTLVDDDVKVQRGKEKEEEKAAVNNLNVPKRPLKLFYMKQKSNKIVDFDEHDADASDDSVNANSIAFSGHQTLVHIVLLEDLEVRAQVSDKAQQQPRHHHHHNHKYKSQRYNGCAHCSLGTFTSFVTEVLQHLPHAAYQKMITDKCHNNSKFAKFYGALRNPAFKPYIEGLKEKPNIKSIMTTLSSHGLDVNSLETIAFEVISWGPNI